MDCDCVEGHRLNKVKSKMTCFIARLAFILHPPMTRELLVARRQTRPTVPGQMQAVFWQGNQISMFRLYSKIQKRGFWMSFWHWVKLFGSALQGSSGIIVFLKFLWVEFEIEWVELWCKFKSCVTVSVTDICVINLRDVVNSIAKCRMNNSLSIRQYFLNHSTILELPHDSRDHLAYGCKINVE